MHLLGLTVVETCRLCLPDTTAVLALKWPNDIYASVDGRLEKIGGIFVNNIPGTPSGSRNRILIGERTSLLDYARLMLQQGVV